MTLQLLATDGQDRPATVLLPQAPGSAADAIARSLAEGLDGGYWRLLPVPDMGADVRAQRAWHRDLWLAMSAADRGSVALATGPTAGYLAPALADAARTVAVVRDPLTAVGAIAESFPKRRVLESLAEGPSEEAQVRLRRFANPQSRTLLSPWHDPAELSVSLGPPADADRWRETLFEDVLPRVDATAMERAPDIAGDLARSLGGRPKPVVQAVRAVVQDEVHLLEDPMSADLMLGLNWLDAELHERLAPREIDADGDR